jgi:hypothetical protein
MLGNSGKTVASPAPSGAERDDMKIDIRPRRAGKTTDLIKECAENGGYIVCAYKREAYNIFDAAKKMGLDIPLPITFNEFVRGEFVGTGIKVIYIDNIELCIQSISSAPVKTITASCDG